MPLAQNNLDIIDSSGGTSGFRNPAFPVGGQLRNLLEGADPGASFLKLALPNLITLAFIVASVTFFFMLIWGAISWIMSAGDKGAVEGARSRITSAVVGIFILLAMYAIINIIEVFFGINIITLDIGVLKIQ